MVRLLGYDEARKVAYFVEVADRSSGKEYSLKEAAPKTPALIWPALLEI